MSQEAEPVDVDAVDARSDDTPPFGQSRLHPLAIIGMIAAVVPFVAQARSTVSVTLDGVTETSSTDPIAFIAGAFALAAAVAAAALVLRGPRSRRATTLIVAVVALGIGGYHVASGLGAFAPSTRTSFSFEIVEEPVGPSWRCSVDDRPGCVVGCEQHGDPTACTMASGLFAGLGDGPPDFVRARDYAGRACDAGDGFGCGNLAALHLQGQGGPKDETRAADLFERACRGGDHRRCVLALSLRLQVESRIADTLVVELVRIGCTGSEDATAFCFDEAVQAVEAAPVFAPQIWRALCDEADEARACNELGNHLTRADAEPRDRTRAVALYERACAMGARDGCLNRGLEALRADPIDLTKARAMFAAGCRARAPWCVDFGKGRASERERTELLRAACEAGDAGACNDLGVSLLEGPSDAADRTAAVAFVARGCEAGEVVACRNMALHHLGVGAIGEGVRPDTEAAWEALVGACAAANGRERHPCFAAAEAVRKVDIALARRVALRGCDIYDEADACAEAPFYTADGSPTDDVVSRSRRACELDSAYGCKNYGVMHRDGDFGVTRDVARYVALFAKACDLGLSIACAELAEVYTAGREGIDARADEAARYAGRACALGHEDLCAEERAAPSP